MWRRDFLALLSALAGAWPFLAHAQQKAMPVIGSLSSSSPPENLDDLVRGPVHQGMGELGFVDGQNMVWEYRWAEFHYDRLPALAADLVSRKVDLIVTQGGVPSALAAKNATSTIPIVFSDVADPVGAGLVASLARPGGNLTGFSSISLEMQPKWLDFLCELVPQATVIALLVNPDNVGHSEQYFRSMQEASRAKGVRLPVLKARTEDEIDTAFASLGQLQAGGLIATPDSLLDSRFKQLVALESRYAVPVVSELRAFAAAGGLVSYGVYFIARYRQGRYLRGQDLEGQKTGRSPGAAADHLSAGRQSQDSQSARADRAAINPRARRRGH